MDDSTSGGAGVASAVRLTISAAVALAIAFGNAVQRRRSLGFAQHAGWGSGLDAVALGALGELVGRWPVGATQDAVEFVGEQLDDVLGVVDAAACVQAAPRLEEAAPHQSTRPVPAQATDVVALAVSVTGLDHEFVEERPMLLRHTRSDRSIVGLRNPAIRGGTEQCRELERRHLGERGPVDIVAGDRAPRVQLEPGVDGGSGVGAQRSYVVDGRERGGRHSALLDGASHRAQHLGGLDRRRRATREQTGCVIRVDAPLLAVCEQIARRYQVTAVGREVPIRPLAEVLQRRGDVRRQLGVVEGARIDRLQCEVLRELRARSRSNHSSTSWRQRRSANACSAVFARRRSSGCSRDSTFITKAGGGAFGVDPGFSPTASGRM